MRGGCYPNNRRILLVGEQNEDVTLKRRQVKDLLTCIGEDPNTGAFTKAFDTDPSSQAFCALPIKSTRHPGRASCTCKDMSCKRATAETILKPRPFPGV